MRELEFDTGVTIQIQTETVVVNDEVPLPGIIGESKDGHPPAGKLPPERRSDNVAEMRYRNASAN